VIPDQTLKGVHFVKTPEYVQLTGVGDFTKLNIPQGDTGGELDNRGADAKGNPGTSIELSAQIGFMYLLLPCSWRSRVWQQLRYWSAVPRMDILYLGPRVLLPCLRRCSFYAALQPHI